jgi:O-antigen/teichoic acid export membrane protein
VRPVTGAPSLTLVERLRKLPLPAGTIPVATGLALAGLMQYGFLVVAARALGQARFAPLSVFWALLFVCGPGFFLPLEQETGRAIAARRVRGEGGRPIVERAAVIGAALAVALIATTLALASPIDRRVFDGDPALLAGLIGGFVAYLLEFLARGTLAGNGRFGSYGILIGGEGALRVVFAAVLAVIGIKVAGPYGVAMILASLLAIVLGVAGRRGLLSPGPHAPWSEVSHALGFLLVASVFTQLLLSVGAVAVQLLASASQTSAAGRFQLSRIVAYVPIFLFQAVQSALLPKLSSLAAGGRLQEFRSLLFRLLLMVGALGLVAIAGFTLLGPAITGLLFGHGFELSNLDFALLSASCIGFIVTQLFGYALISLAGYRRVAIGWTVGGIVFIGVAALGSQLFLRVELGLLCGALASSAVMAALLLSLLRERLSLDTEPRIAEANPA